MTDSGSFDSGDLIYAADIGNLTTLINAKCAEAGVTASPYVAGNFVAGNLVGAAAHNNLIAAYQRAWDASTNKPGTRQAAVSQGGLIYGSLYQSMWTQLNQMTFAPAYFFTSDSNTFTCSLDASTANSNEVGVGGGFSSSDLTLTCGGNILAAAGSPPSREFNIGYLTATEAFLNAIIRNRNTWTFGWVLHDTNDETWFPLYARIDVYDKVLVMVDSAHRLGLTVGHNGATVCDAVTTYTPSAVPATGTVILMVWSDGTYLRAGFVTSPSAVPTKWSDFASTNRISVTCNLNQLNPSGAAYSDTHVFGEDSYRLDAAYGYQFMASKACLINNAA